MHTSLDCIIFSCAQFYLMSFYSSWPLNIQNLLLILPIRGHIEWLNWKQIKDYQGRKSVMVTARRSPVLRSWTRTERWKLLKGLLHGRQQDTEIWEGSVSDMQTLPMTHIEDWTQECIPFNSMMTTAKAKILSAVLKEKAGPDYHIEFTVSSVCSVWWVCKCWCESS